MNEYLLIDCCNNSSINLCLNESATKGLVKFRGVFQSAGETNKNNRRYDFGVLDENVNKLAETIKARGLIGELDHPTDSIIHFEKASHVITKLWWEGKKLMGEGEILNTPHGKILLSLINDGVRVGMSSRGVGTGKTDENGILVISENYKLITFDVVADPSTASAFQEKVMTQKREDSISQNSSENSVKNEGKCINKISKEALIACLGGLIETNINQIKARIS